MPAATQATTLVEFTHFHLFCGIGGGARGFNDSPEARLGSFRARMRCIGGVDNDAGALKDFERLTSAPGTMMDLFSALQFAQYHAACASKASKRCKDCNNTGLPPAGWREVTPADLRLAAGGPDIGASDLTDLLIVTADGDALGWVMAMISEPEDPPGVERCVALDGSLDGPCSCRIYDERPKVCREFERDSASCERARARW